MCIIISPSTAMLSIVGFLTVSPKSFFLYNTSLITCYFRSSFKHSVQTGVSTPKMISLYLIMVPLMAFWRSSVDITFRRGTFNSSACAKNFVSVICNPQLGYESIFFCTAVYISFYTSKYPSSSKSLKMLHCWFSGSVHLHSSTYMGMVVFTLFLYTVNL